jgi:Tfp pilus assembly protein PilN
MRAVNLIPVGERRGVGNTSGLGSYIVLGLLALVVAMSAAYTLANRSLGDHRQELASVEARATAIEGRAQALDSYTAFSTLRQKRSETIRALAASRFDWSHTLHEVARTIPADAWLTSMRGTVSPSASAEGGGTDPLRTSLPGPALELIGCTTSHDKVAEVISNLRRVDGVERVSLSSSVKNGGSDGGGGGGAGGDCRHGSAHFPQFSMTLFFASPTASTAANGKTP